MVLVATAGDCRLIKIGHFSPFVLEISSLTVPPMAAGIVNERVASMARTTCG